MTRNEDVTFTRLEDGPHHDGVRFGNGAEVTLQQLGTGVQGLGLRRSVVTSRGAGDC